MRACSTMSSAASHDTFLAASSLLTLLNLLLLLLPASSPLDEGLMLVEGKVRLGSAPPSCRNRCNACTPCSAVEDPTTPAQPSLVQPTAESSAKDDDRFSNYKPLGWKCRCGDRLFNP